MKPIAKARALALRLPILRDIKALKAQVRDLTAATGQLEDVVAEAGGLLPPPPHLQRRVVGAYDPTFLRNGRAIVNDIERVLTSVGESLSNYDPILDYGCGCGRVTRALAGRHTMHATDIDEEAIAWCQEHYSHFAAFALAGHAPPLPYPNDTFAFIYGISVFTHLPEEMQHAWLAELARITKPGGYLLLTVHGANHHHKLDARGRAAIAQSGFYYWAAGGDTEGLPDFYQRAYHTEQYVRSVWAKYFDVVAYVPVAIQAWQDAILCRKRLA
jgi:SAM-dependent methyltransferase